MHHKAGNNKHITQSQLLDDLQHTANESPARMPRRQCRNIGNL